MSSLLRDFRITLRQLTRRPWVPLVVVLSLALGIGANSSMFSIANAIFLSPLGAIEAPGELVVIYPPTSAGEPYGNVSYPRFLEYRESLSTLSDVAAYRDVPATVTVGEAATRVDAQLVTGDYFSTLGVGPVAGRVIGPEDEGGAGGSPVAVLGHEQAESLFGDAARAVGSTIQVNGQSYEVVGVADPAFRGTGLEHRTGLWIPLPMIADVMPAWGSKPLEMRAWAFFRLIGRLAPGATLAESEHELASLAPRIEDWTEGDVESRRMVVLPLREASFSPEERGSVVDYATLLLGISALLLLLTGVNVLNLLLYRVRKSDRETAIRLVLGARRLQLVVRALMDAMILAVAGGVMSLGIAVLAGRIFSAVELPVSLEIDPGLDLRVLLFTIGLTLLVGLALGCATAAITLRANLSSTIKGGRAPRPGGFRWSHAAVVFQIAFTLLFLVASGLLGRTLYNLRTTDPGFRGDSVVLATLDTPSRGLSKEETRAYLDRVLRTLEQRPQVQRASLSSAVPLGPQDMEFGLYTSGSSGDEPPTATTKLVTPGYFETLKIPLRRGRVFRPEERTNGRKVAVLNASAAERLFGTTDPIGQRLGFNSDELDWEIVGIVGDVHEASLREEPGPMVYFPYPTLAKLSGAPMTLVARVAGNPDVVGQELVAALRPLDALVGIYDVESLDSKLAASIDQERQIAILLIAFALIALVLSAIGLYGVLSYFVDDRVREIGVRLALGAPRTELLGMILRRSGRMLLVGVVLGLAVAMAALRILAGLLFGVAWTSPGHFVASLLFLGAVVILISLFPAWRAVRLDPARAIRYE